MNDYDYRSFKALKKFKITNFVKVALVLKDSGINGIVQKLKRKKVIKKYKNIDDKIYKNIKFKENAIDIVVDKNIDIKDVLEKLENVDFKYNLFKISNNPVEFKNYYEITELFLRDYFWYRAFIFISPSTRLLSNFYNCINVKNASNLINTINKITNDITGLKVLSNYNNKNNITVKAATFFNEYGTNYYSGGAERYLVDLYGVCKNVGFNLDIYQNSEIPYMRKFEGINVIGLANKHYPMNYSLEYIKEQSKCYSCASRYFSKLHIYSAFYECFPYHRGPSIGISHGVAWDNKGSVKTDGVDFWKRNEQIIESACMCDKLVSVDTNTANWFQTIDFDLGNQRVKVIPNYVDINEFKVVNKKKDDKIVITYPRRLYEPRGMYLLLDVVDEIFKKYKNVEIHFVGKGFDEDVNKIKDKMKKYPKRLFCYSMTPDRMYEVYQNSDITLIPTIYSEGTSLSCLEAMASGNIVISTRIGGLTDLVINGYNGYLIEPTKDDLLKAIEDVLDNFNNQDVIKKRARETAEVFNKEKWIKRWTEVLDSFNLKGSSSTVDLVEFYVEDILKISQNTFDLIKKAILENNLVYIRSKKKPLEDKISNGLLQLVPIDEEIVSTAKKVYVEKALEKEVHRKEKIELI